jgi:hypothetical protein
MQLKQKKIIARELLFLVVAIIIAALAYFSIYPYNSYYQKQANSILSDTLPVNTRLADSLAAPYKTKQQQQDWFTNSYTDKFHLVNTAVNRQKIWDHLQQLAEQGKIKNQWQTLDGRIIGFLKGIKIYNAAQFQGFIQQNIITDIDKQNELAAQKIYTQPVVVENGKDLVNEKIFSSAEQLDFTEKIFFSLIILLFGARYLIYFIKWCVNTLQEKEA